MNKLKSCLLVRPARHGGSTGGLSITLRGTQQLENSPQAKTQSLIGGGIYDYVRNGLMAGASSVPEARLYDSISPSSNRMNSGIFINFSSSFHALIAKLTYSYCSARRTNEFVSPA